MGKTPVVRQDCQGDFREKAGEAPIPSTGQGTRGRGPHVLTGSPPEAKEMDCMWWLAMICKAESLLDVARSSSGSSQRWHLLPATFLAGLARHGALQASRALVMSHRPPGKGLGHQQGYWEWDQNQETWSHIRGNRGSPSLQGRSCKACGISPQPPHPQGLRGGGHSAGHPAHPPSP